MEQHNRRSHWSTKLGLFSGPLMIIIALVALNMSNKPKGMAYLILALGIIRTVASAWMHFKQQSHTNQ